MNINNETIESYLRCRYKAFLQIKGEIGKKTEYELFYDELRKNMNIEFLKKIALQQTCFLNPETKITLEHLKKGYDYLSKGKVEYKGLGLQYEFIERVSIKSKLGNFSYIPIITASDEKPKKNNKILLKILSDGLEKTQGSNPEFGKIIFGNNSRITRIKLSDGDTVIDRIFSELDAIQQGEVELELYLNDHCQVCEFNLFCKSKAKENDNLSLLNGIRSKEIKKLNSKGIFTVNQLSYTFRPRKNKKKFNNYKRPHFHELKALAIRENKIYVYETPKISETPIAIYFDIEGIPERNFCYLIGVIIMENDNMKNYYFWADNERDETDIFTKFIALLNRYDN